LPEPQRDQTLKLLREYVVVRRDFATETLLDQAALDRETQRTKALQDQLWQQIVAVTQRSQTAVVATYLQALNEMIDVSEKRLAAFENRVPKTVWFIIFIVAIFQSFVTGFRLRRRLWFSLVMTPIVRQCVEVGLVQGQHLSVDGSFVEANAAKESVNWEGVCLLRSKVTAWVSGAWITRWRTGFLKRSIPLGPN
jgi:hypothetical protein